MGKAPWDTSSEYSAEPSSGARNATAGPLHRIRSVREQQCVTIRTISRRTGVPMRQLRDEEKPSSDLALSVLLRWADALEVPVNELIVEPDMRLSQSVAHRAKLVRAMKTVLTLNEHGGDERSKRLVAMLHTQMLDLMPELTEVTSWPSFGSRRPHDEQGRVAEHPIRMDGFVGEMMPE